MAASRKQEKTRFTYADYCTWPDEERWELIDGVAFDMTAAPSRPHSLITTELMRQLANFFEGKPCEVHDAPFDVRLPRGNEPDEEVDTVVQPDILVVCDPAKLDAKGCRGAPDLVVEILSPSSTLKDAILKRERYQKAGIRQYWIIDPERREVNVLELDAGGRYVLAATHGDHGKVPATLFPGLEIDLDKLFARLPKVVRESPARYL